MNVLATAKNVSKETVHVALVNTVIVLAAIVKVMNHDNKKNLETIFLNKLKTQIVLMYC